jgi:hypothetical protein
MTDPLIFGLLHCVYQELIDYELSQNCHNSSVWAFYASCVGLPFSFRSSVYKFMVDLEHIGNIFSSEKGVR